MKLSTNEINRLIWMIDRNDWLGIQGFAKYMLLARADGLMRKYGSAVKRIEAHFTDVTTNPAWPSEWSNEKIIEKRRIIATFCQEFGSAGPLIADINAARNLKPRSLIYFMVTAKGNKASRWDMLLGSKRKAEWEAVKAAENEYALEIQSDMAVKSNTQPMLNPMTTVIIKNARAEYDALLKESKPAKAVQLRNKIMSLYGHDLSVK